MFIVMVWVDFEGWDVYHYDTEEQAVEDARNNLRWNSKIKVYEIARQIDFTE